MKVSIKKLKPLYIFSLFLSIITCLADVVFLIYLLIPNRISNIDISTHLVLIAVAIFCPIGLIKLNHTILFENYTYPRLEVSQAKIYTAFYKSSNETKAKIYTALSLTIAVLNLLSIILFLNNK